MNGTVKIICISPVAGQPMQNVTEVEAVAGRGLKGDRYEAGEGSFNKGKLGTGQVTLMNSTFFEGSGYTFIDSRRNILTEDVELMYLIGREFKIGGARFRGLKYCSPCERPKHLADSVLSFKNIFFDRGGLIAEIIEGGVIKVGDPVIPPPKSY